MEKVVDPETEEVEERKSTQEDPVTIFPTSASAPVNVERSPAGDQGSFSFDVENSPIHPDETLGDYYYYYRSYSKKKASEIHTPVWNLKKGDTFSDWRVCHDWLQGTFLPGEIQFQEGRLDEQTYQAYLEEAATYTSTTHRIVREWRSMHKEWAAFEASKKKAVEDEAQAALLRAKLKADRAKFENDQKNWREICEKDNNEKIGLRNIIKNLKAEAEAARDEARSHRERSEQREVQIGATLALKEKEIGELTSLLSEKEQLKAEVESDKKYLQLERVKRAKTSRRLSETEEKLENSEIAKVANSVLNADELDETVAHLLFAAQNDGYAQGYVECSHHVVNALKVNWDTRRSTTHGVDTEAALAAMKTQFNTLQLPVMDLVIVALQSEDFVTQLREIFPERNDDDDLA
ncbi:hypothetical protein Hanom_Chr01g00025321 [Helianthus anomalus]